MIESESRIYLDVDTEGSVNELVQQLVFFQNTYGEDAIFSIEDTQRESTFCIIINSK